MVAAEDFTPLPSRPPQLEMHVRFESYPQPIQVKPLSTGHNGVVGCRPEPIGPNTPTGIAGCEVFGRGIASHYGPGLGVAMNFCTWERRYETGCGSVRIRSLDTGLSVVAAVVDFCDCYTGTANERIVDLQWGLLDLLGLHHSRGLYQVEVTREN